MKLEDWKMSWIGAHPENASHILNIFKPQEEREWDAFSPEDIRDIEGTETEEMLKNLGFAIEDV